ncbi:hypothetical protein RRG08_024351 [Elysia crispata]|uniref:Uncharacterized protein n=1 Tax=Elysia crispata TaxID=231223 RepID=A0AAE1DI10_9GAST|nr:hypothetical protein RRG08_024351 [Elysia crispata]
MAHKNHCKGEIPTRLHKKQLLENELAFLGRTERQLVQINQNLPLVRGGCFKSFTIDRAGSRNQAMRGSGPSGDGNLQPVKITTLHLCKTLENMNNALLVMKQCQYEYMTVLLLAGMVPQRCYDGMPTISATEPESEKPRTGSP